MDDFHRSIALIAGIALLASPSLSSGGEREQTNDTVEWEFTQQRGENPIRGSSTWKDVVGHRVAVEGIFWGAGTAKGFGEYVILHGGLVYLQGSSFIGMDGNGKLVRVVGTLTLKHNKKVPHDVQGYEYDFDAFIIKPDKVKILDRVTWPWMEDLGKPAQK